MSAEPIRINRYLALKGYCTRREADKIIVAGKVFINGRQAELGDKVQDGEKVELVGHRKKTYSYFRYHKPVGISTDAQPGETDIRLVVGRRDIFPIGRLDKESHGLILLTDDGRITDRILNPKLAHEKEYEVTVDKKITPFLVRHLSKGVQIEGYQTKTAVVEKLDDHRLRIVLTEGKRHQIRRMCAALGFQVTELVRTRIMNLKLGKLKVGDLELLNEIEIKELLKSLKLS